MIFKINFSNTHHSKKHGKLGMSLPPFNLNAG